MASRYDHLITGDSPGDSPFFSVGDVAAGFARGVGYAAGDFYGLVDVLSFDLLPDWDARKTFGESSTTGGKLAAGVSQFLTGFLATGGALGVIGKVATANRWTNVAKGARFLAGGKGAKAAGTRPLAQQSGFVGPLSPAAQALKAKPLVKAGGTLTQAAAKGAVVDFAFFNGHEGNLSSALKGTVLENPISELLASDPEDPELLGRLKNTLEGAGMGMLFDGLSKALVEQHAVRTMARAAKDAKLADEAELLKSFDASELRETANRSAKAAEKVKDKLGQDVGGALDNSAEQTRSVMGDTGDFVVESGEPTGSFVLFDPERSYRTGQTIEDFDGDSRGFLKGLAFDHEDPIVLEIGDSSTLNAANVEGTISASGETVLRGAATEDNVTRIYFNPEEFADQGRKELQTLTERYPNAEVVLTGLDTDVEKLRVRRKVSRAVQNAPADVTTEDSIKSVMLKLGVKEFDKFQASVKAAREGIDPRLGGSPRDLSADELIELGLEASDLNLTTIATEDSAIRLFRDLQNAVITGKRNANSATWEEQANEAVAYGVDVMNITNERSGVVTAKMARTLSGDADTLEQIRTHMIVAKPILSKAGRDWMDVMEPLVDRLETLDDDTWGQIIETYEGVGNLMQALTDVNSGAGRLLNATQIEINAGSFAERNVATNEAQRLSKQLRTAEKLKTTAGRATVAGAKRQIAADIRQTVKLMKQHKPGTKEFDNAFFKGNRMSRTGRRWQKTQEYMYFSMLSGHKTHIVNFVSNLAGLVISPAETAAAGMVTMMRGGGHRGLVKAWDEVAGMASVAFDMAKMRGQSEIFESVKRAWKSGNSQLLEGAEKFGGATSGAITGGGARASLISTIDMFAGRAGAETSQLGTTMLGDAINNFAGDAVENTVNVAGGVISVPGRALAAADELFKQLHFRADTMAEFRARGRAAGMTGDDLSTFVADGLTNSVMDGQAYSLSNARRRATLDAIEQLGEKAGDAKILNQRVEELLETTHNPVLDSITQSAVSRAETYTHTQPLDSQSAIDRSARFLQGMTESYPILKPFLPFIKTPANILKFAGERTGVPAALAHTKVGMAKLQASVKGLPFDPTRLLESGDKHVKTILTGTDDARDELLARMGVATGTIIGVTALAANGLDETNSAGVAIYGRGPHDPKEREAWQAAGRQAYSIRIGDEYISYKRLDPFSTVLGVIADIATYAHFSKDEETEGLVYAAFASLSENFVQKSYLQGLDTLMTVMMSGDPDKAAKAINNLAGIAVPTAFGQVNTSQFEDRMLDVRSYTDAMMAKVPYMSGNIEARRNVLGEEMQRIGWDSPYGFMSRWSPFPITSEEQADPIMIELANTGHPWAGTRRDMVHRGVKFDLYEHVNEDGVTAKDRLGALRSTVTVGGATLRESLSDLIGSEWYQSLPQLPPDDAQTAPRVKLLQGVIARYSAHAKQALLVEFPEIDEAAQAQTNPLFQ